MYAGAWDCCRFGLPSDKLGWGGGGGERRWPYQLSCWPVWHAGPPWAGNILEGTPTNHLSSHTGPRSERPKRTTNNHIRPARRHAGGNYMGPRTGPPGSVQRSVRPEAYIIDHKVSYLPNRQRAAVQRFDVTVAGIKRRARTRKLRLLGARLVDKYRRIRGLLKPTDTKIWVCDTVRQWWRMRACNRSDTTISIHIQGRPKVQFPGAYPDFHRHLKYFATQRAAGRASMRAYMVIYGSFRSLAVRCIVLLGAGRSVYASLYGCLWLLSA